MSMKMMRSPDWTNVSLKKTSVWALAVGLLLGAVLPLMGAGWDPEKDQAEMSKAKEALARMKEADPGLGPFFDHAYGYVVFAEKGKAGFIVAGAHGTGIVWEQGQVVGSASVTEITVGAQAGGMSCSEILFFKDKAAMDQFKEGRMEFSANAAAVVVKNGAAAAASYDNGVAVFIMGLKGAMVDASIGGQKFTFHAK